MHSDIQIVRPVRDIQVSMGEGSRRGRVFQLTPVRHGVSGSYRYKYHDFLFHPILWWRKRSPSQHPPVHEPLYSLSLWLLNEVTIKPFVVILHTSVTIQDQHNLYFQYTCSGVRPHGRDQQINYVLHTITRLHCISTRLAGGNVSQIKTLSNMFPWVESPALSPS